MDNYNIPGVLNIRRTPIETLIPEDEGESSNTTMVLYKATRVKNSNTKVKNNSSTVVEDSNNTEVKNNSSTVVDDSNSTDVGQNSSTFVESKNEGSCNTNVESNTLNTNVESNTSLNTNVESNNASLESLNENTAGELIKGDNVPLELNDSTVREFFNSSNALLESSSSSNQTTEVVHKTMHGFVQLPDNRLPNLHGYPKPVDYQDLIGQYCDI
jgi:hypothetical protein